MPPDEVPQSPSAKSDQTPLFGGAVLAAILILAIVGQTTGLLSVLRHSSQLEAKQVRSDTLDSEIKKLTISTTSANTEAALAAKESEASRGRMQQLKSDEESLRGKVIPMQESVRKSEQELNALRSETAKLSGQRDALLRVRIRQRIYSAKALVSKIVAVCMLIAAGVVHGHYALFLSCCSSSRSLCGRAGDA